VWVQILFLPSAIVVEDEDDEKCFGVNEIIGQ